MKMLSKFNCLDENDIVIVDMILLLKLFCCKKLLIEYFIFRGSIL